MTTTTGSKRRASSMQAANYHSYLENWSEAQKTVRVQRVPLSSQQSDWIEKAWSLLDVKKALDLDVALEVSPALDAAQSRRR